MKRSKMNHLTNWSFEEGHHHQGGTSELVVPDGWYLHYLDNADFPGIGTPPAYRPESVVWHISGAPEHERDLFFLDGDYCLKVFKPFAPIYFALTQHVTGLTPGTRYRFTAQVFPDIVEGYENGDKVWATDQWAAEARAGWSDPATSWPAGYDGSVEWSEWFNKHAGDLAFGEYGDVFVEFVAPASGEVRVWLECKAKWGLPTNGFFMDAFRLEAVGGEPEPPPPEPPAGDGYPRVPYARTYVLLWQDAEREWMLAAAAGSHEKRYTIGKSADDAGMGPGLESRTVIAVNPSKWPDDLQAFFAKHYPGAIYSPLSAATPADLELALTGGLTPVPPEPEPPEPQPRQTRGHWGLHLQAMLDGTERFHRNVKPPVAKCFIFEDIPPILAWSPDTEVIGRLWIGNDNDPYLKATDHNEAARDFIGRFKDSVWMRVEEVEAQGHRTRLPLFRMASLNETYSNDLAIVERAVSFDCAFVQETHAEFGDKVGAAVLTAPVGNPNESQYHLLAPLAELAMRYSAVFSYHNYWWITRGGIVDGWPWYAGRWAEMDAVLATYGLAPLWYSGESGVIRSAHEGWRGDDVYGGDWQRTLEDVMLFDDLAAAWNAEHDDRYLGALYFTTNIKDGKWDSFLVTEAEMLALEAAMLARYP